MHDTVVEYEIALRLEFFFRGVAGDGVVGVVLFEVLLNATSMLNHGNVRPPRRVDRLLRWPVVTPEMHRVDHSEGDDETNSNIGFTLPWWDRLRGTYRDQTRAGHLGMIIGIHRCREPQQVNRFLGMLRLPFQGGVSDYAINCRQWSGSDEG